MIQLNGETFPLATRLPLLQLLAQLGFQDRRLAVELNLEIVPRSQYAQTEIQPGDRLEIVEAIGGG